MPRSSSIVLEFSPLPTRALCSNDIHLHPDGSGAFSKLKIYLQLLLRRPTTAAITHQIRLKASSHKTCVYARESADKSNNSGDNSHIGGISRTTSTRRYDHPRSISLRPIAVDGAIKLVIKLVTVLN